MYRGKEYAVVARGAGKNGARYAGLLLAAGDDVSRFDEVVNNSRGTLARVPLGALERYESVTTLGTVDGFELILYGADDEVPCYFSGPPDWAREHGFTGSQHDGWTGTVALAALSGIHERVFDLLKDAGIQPSSGAAPPHSTSQRSSGGAAAEALDSIVMLLLEEPALAGDPHWDSFAVLVSVTPIVVSLSAYRYTGSAAGKPTPVRGRPFQLFRDLQAATAAPDGREWHVCILKVERDTRQARVDFVYGDEAERWTVTPDNYEHIIEALRP